MIQILESKKHTQIIQSDNPNSNDDAIADTLKSFKDVVSFQDKLDLQFKNKQKFESSSPKSTKITDEDELYWQVEEKIRNYMAQSLEHAKHLLSSDRSFISEKPQEINSPSRNRLNSTLDFWIKSIDSLSPNKTDGWHSPIIKSIKFNFIKCLFS